MTTGARYAVVVLFVLSVAIGISAYLAAIGYYHASQAAQRRQGAAVELKLCTTLDRLAALMPPPGSPAVNPSRAYEQALHTVLAQLGPDVGCK